MTAFTSRWLDWQPSNSTEGREDGGNGSVRGTTSPTPETLIQRTDRTDKSPSVSFVSASPKRFQPEFGAVPGDGAFDESVLPSGWGDASALVEWFLTTEPPSQSLELCKGVVIANPALWWAALMRDIAEGPNGPRARYGAMQADLRRLAAASQHGNGAVHGY